jgi:uncharacterized protein (TIGR01319 family)
VYSHTTSFHGEEGWVLRGIREPDLTRTVEGDLGMRVSALSAWQTGSRYIRHRLGEGTTAADAWVRRAARHTDILPSTGEERGFDDLLAEACLFHALLRHAGTVEETYAASGKVRVQRGKDLRGIRRIISSGGFLSRRGSDSPVRRALAAARSHVDERTGAASLLPENPEIQADSLYLVTLLGAITAAHPEAARDLAAMEGHAHA